MSRVTPSTSKHQVGSKSQGSPPGTEHRNDVDPKIGVALAYGTYEEALTFVGSAPVVRTGDVEVNWTTIRLFCGAVEDANPSYWDADAATAIWGGIIAPAALLMSWVIELPWKPKGLAGAPLLMTQVPLPGPYLVNVVNETEHLAPLFLGDRISAHEVVESVSPLKTTALGSGHFVTTVSTFVRAGETVAIQRNTLFRFGQPSPEE